MSTKITPSTFLRFALLGDALASGATGLLLAGAAGSLSGWLGLPDAFMRPVGVFLLAYAGFVAFVGSRPAPLKPMVMAIIVANTAWVFKSSVLLMGGLVQPTMLGVAFVLAQAMVVAAFAVAQFVGLRRSCASTSVSV